MSRTWSATNYNLQLNEVINEINFSSYSIEVMKWLEKECFYLRKFCEPIPSDFLYLYIESDLLDTLEEIIKLT